MGFLCIYVLFLLIDCLQMQSNVRVTFVTVSKDARERSEYIFKDMSILQILSVRLMSQDDLLETLTLNLPMERSSKITFTVERTDSSMSSGKSQGKAGEQTSKLSGKRLKEETLISKSLQPTSASGAACAAPSTSIVACSKRKSTEKDSMLHGSTGQLGLGKPKDSSNTSKMKKRKIGIGKPPKRSGSLATLDKLSSSLTTLGLQSPGSPQRYLGKDVHVYMWLGKLRTLAEIAAGMNMVGMIMAVSLCLQILLCLTIRVYLIVLIS